jgi:predicted TIM-barrel fold metal-dependent hydrolase
VIEPPDLWTSRVDRKFVDRAPRIVRGDTSDLFVCEGALAEKMGIGLLATGRKWTEPKGWEQYSHRGRFEEVCRGAYDPEARLKLMEPEGVEAELLYTTLGLNLYSLPDLELQAGCFKAFNDWMAEFCSAAPNRLFGVAMIPLEPVEAAIAELERCARMGLRGAMMSIAHESGRGYDNPMWDPMWAALGDLRIPLSLHVVGSNKNFIVSDNILTDISLAFTPTMYTLSAMIFSGVFDRHRQLKVISVENDASWAAAMLQRMDDHLEHDRGWAKHANGITSGRTPSQIFHEHVACTFMRDETAIFNRYRIGVHNLMWGADYPHFDGAWPNCFAELARNFVEGVPKAEQRMIGRTNAIDLYSLPLEP